MADTPVKHAWARLAYMGSSEHGAPAVDWELTLWNWAAVCLHLVSAVLVGLVLGSGDVVYHTTKTSAFVVAREGAAGGDAELCGGGLFIRGFSDRGVVCATLEPAGVQLSLRAMLGTFFLLSAGFQLAFQSSTMRYIEFSISGSLMAVVIVLQTLATDLLVVGNVFFLHMACMLMGAAADVLHGSAAVPETRGRGNSLVNVALIQTGSTGAAVGEKGSGEQRGGGPRPFPAWARKWVVHAAAWLPFALAWALIFGSFHSISARSPTMPREVVGVVVGEFVLFVGFGLTQAAQLAGLLSLRGANFFFILQSFTSKAFLGYWLAWEIFL